MKLLLTAEEHAEAVERYLDVDHGIMVSLQGTLGPIDIDFDLVENAITTNTPPTPIKQLKPAVLPKVIEEHSVDSEREEVIARAEELGISFRSDIKTDTLIKRIEEREEELVEQAQSDAAPGEVDLDDEDDLSQEIPKTKTVEEMIVEDEAMDAENEEETKPVKRSMFDVKAKQVEADSEEDESEQPKKRSTFFDKLNKGK